VITPTEKLIAITALREEQEEAEEEASPLDMCCFFFLSLSLSLCVFAAKPQTPLYEKRQCS
jgi:hypothetical protein